MGVANTQGPRPLSDYKAKELKIELLITTKVYHISYYSFVMLVLVLCLVLLYQDIYTPKIANLDGVIGEVYYYVKLYKIHSKLANTWH